MRGRFELDGAFTVEHVPEVRRFVERLHGHVASDELLSRVSMAAHELFENAVKFSADGLASLRVDAITPRHFLITTRNRASSGDVVALRAMTARMRATGDMMKFYLDLMRGGPRTRGGLGIGRVAAEAEMDVDIELDGDLVVIRAEMGFEDRAA